MNNPPNAEFAKRKKELKELSKSELISMIFFLESKLKKIERLLHIFENSNTPSSKKRFKKKKLRKRRRSKMIRTKRGFLAGLKGMRVLVSSC